MIMAMQGFHVIHSEWRFAGRPLRVLVKEQFWRSAPESKLGREGREARMGQSLGRNGRTDGLACSLRSGSRLTGVRALGSRVGGKLQEESS